MKKLLLISCLLSTTILRSQTWEALGGGITPSYGVRGMYSDTVDNYLYASGSFRYQTSDNRELRGIARWDGVKWDSLGTGMRNWAFAFARYNNDLYIGGVFDSVGSLKCKGIGIWKGNAWDTMSVQPFKNNFGSSNVLSMAIIDNELYFGGSFDSVNNLPCRSIAKWNGTSIIPIGFPSTVNWGYVFTICEFNNEIYIGGNFSSTLYPNDTIQDIIKYNGTTWSSVGGGMAGGLTMVNSMVVFNNELYVAGYFSTAAGNIGNNIQKWNGSIWTDVGGGTADGSGQVNKLIVFKNKLYALGNFEAAGGIPCSNIASWDGTEWCAEGSIFDNTIGAGCIYRDSLCVGGGFWTINGDSMNFISKWKGTNLIDTCGHLEIGINEHDNSNDYMNIYPNPASTQITIEFDLTETRNTSIEIKNMLGETIKKVNNGFSIGNNKLEIDVSELPKGLFFVQLVNGSTQVIQKFIAE
ncbi:MAG: hypothetical protein K0S44_3262 [Bacteroidetes bacterium]|jgi:hypothetical protein|nr:hypothetical protein [Bacteroidota bacterium]